MNKIACTHCEKVTADEGLVGWITIEPHRHAVSVVLFRHQECEGTFCSEDCAIAWLTERRERRSGQANSNAGAGMGAGH